VSDSPLPIPSGYFCHTSYAIGKGRQPQQYDCPLFLSLLPLTLRRRSRTQLPQFHPREPIFYWSPSKASFRALSLFARFISPFSWKPLKKQTSSFRGITEALAAVLCDPSLFSREGWSCPTLRDENLPHDSLFLKAHLPCRMRMSTGTEKNLTKLGDEMGNITSS